MPKLNGTGPMGQGVGTGRGMGNCFSRGMRRFHTYRCGCGRRFISPKNELQALEDEEKMLLEELEIIKAEKQALENEK
ncbi:MAG TPA: DUF5320 domain-containing protein [bacterium]|nr:DUF5320 domain-containing protein [bacterium]HOG38489.1 DUF5320 domain-containing protein [bacterium]